MSVSGQEGRTVILSRLALILMSAVCGSEIMGSDGAWAKREGGREERLVIFGLCFRGSGGDLEMRFPPPYPDVDVAPWGDCESWRGTHRAWGCKGLPQDTTEFLSHESLWRGLGIGCARAFPHLHLPQGVLRAQRRRLHCITEGGLLLLKIKIGKGTKRKSP